MQKIVFLDDSLREYGLAIGATAEIHRQKLDGSSVPVWTYRGQLQARFLRDEDIGWKTAYTSFGYAGQIRYFLNPRDVEQIRSVGYVQIPQLAETSNQ